VILGGTELGGGSGTVVGSVTGAIVPVPIENGLDLMNAPPFIYAMVRGGVLLVAVAIDRHSSTRRDAAPEASRSARMDAQDRRRPVLALETDHGT